LNFFLWFFNQRCCLKLNFALCRLQSRSLLNLVSWTKTLLLQSSCTHQMRCISWNYFKTLFNWFSFRWIVVVLLDRAFLSIDHLVYLCMYFFTRVSKNHITAILVLIAIISFGSFLIHNHKYLASSCAIAFQSCNIINNILIVLSFNRFFLSLRGGLGCFWIKYWIDRQKCFILYYFDILKVLVWNHSAIQRCSRCRCANFCSLCLL
jgi:hypothetical protein